MEVCVHATRRKQYGGIIVLHSVLEQLRRVESDGIEMKSTTLSLHSDPLHAYFSTVLCRFLTGVGRGQMSLLDAGRTPEDLDESAKAGKTIAVKKFEGEHLNRNFSDVRTRERASNDEVGSLQCLMH